MQPGEVVEDRFTIEAVAGFGGMGTVYRARDRASGEVVALKVLRGASETKRTGEVAERFAREIRVLAALRHPGIVRYVADGRTREGEQWLAMEWLDGESLSKRLARAPLTTNESIDLARRIAEAVGVAHERGVIHRDLKPSNLFLPNGDLERVKVLDFGVARITDASRVATRTGMMVGTPGYMAPEQVKTERDITVRVDVFAVGCVLFECLTGRPAFQGDHMLAILAKIVLEDTPHIVDVRPELPPALDALVARAMAKAPADRPRDCTQFALELAALGKIETPNRAPASTTTQTLTGTERRLLCVVLVGEAIVDDRTIVEVPTEEMSGPAMSIETSSGELPIAKLAALDDVARANGAQLDRLADGSYVVTLSGATSARDQVAAAARCALAMKAVVPDSPIAVATGRGVLAGRWPVGEAIDRAVRLLGYGAQRVRLDDVTAGLLDARFELGGDDGGLYVERERDLVEGSRTLLGRETPCVGRDRELGVLVGLFEECVNEPVARAALITGAEGIGKSRVRYEALRRIQESGERAEIWIGRGDPLRAGSAFGMIAPALRRAAGIQDSEPIEVRRHKLRARVMRNASTDLHRTTMFLGELVEAPFPDGDSLELRAARQDPLLMGDQVRRAFEHLLAVETAAQPVVIVLEDLHWGDLSTIKLIDSALRTLPDRPWLVLAFARPEVHELFPRVWGDRCTELRLGELTAKQSERLVRKVLGDWSSADGRSLDDALVARLVDQAAGNAFYLEELIRAVAEGKQELPETVLALIQGRLERLEGDARKVLRAASIFGHRFWRGGVAALVGGGRESATRMWLDELVERELIANVPTSRFTIEAEFRFRQALVRDAAYAMLTDADRRLGHQLAAEWLELAGEGDPMTLAEHFERGGEPARAANWFFQAAERALVGCDFDAAIVRAERGIGCGAKGELLGALWLVIAEANKWSGHFEPAARTGLQALALLPYASARWFAAAGETAESCGKVEDKSQLEAIGVQLRDVPTRPETLAPRVTATAQAAFQLFYNGRYELAQVLLDRIELVAFELVEPGVLARVYQARSSRAMFAGDAGAYLEHEQAAAVEFDRAGDLRYACMQRGHVGYACLEIGAYEDAERHLRDALDAGTRLGLSNVVATAKHNLGRALMHRGALPEALAIEQEAFEDFNAHRDRRLAGAARLYTSYILLELGEVGQAQREIELALETAGKTMRPQMLASLARVMLVRGAVAEAAAIAREASDTLDAIGSIEEGEALVRLMLVETRLSIGDRDGAREAARIAYTRLVERASRITAVAWRSSFLGNIVEHQRTRELALALGVAFEDSRD